jgi:hypothetical protein
MAFAELGQDGESQSDADRALELGYDAEVLEEELDKIKAER